MTYLLCLQMVQFRYTLWLLYALSANISFPVESLPVSSWQGNGHEHDFTSDPNVFIMDMYNPDIYPGDHVAERGISCPVRVKSGTQDEAYLETLDR